jgi:FKBP-type peptidyl-prolyl cis-trans isomerase
MMKEGDEWELVIPYQLAYGEEGRPPAIPAKSTLVFRMTLQKVEFAK